MLALLAPAPVFAASQPGTATALTIRPLGIVNTDDLDFGIMAPSAAAGTVTVNAQTGARTAGGGAILAGGAPGAAQFTIAGTPLRVVTFSLNPNNNLVLARIGGGASMTVNQFRVSYDGLLPVPIGPNQLEGTYEGIFAVTVDYQ